MVNRLLIRWDRKMNKRQKKKALRKYYKLCSVCHPLRLQFVTQDIIDRERKKLPKITHQEYEWIEKSGHTIGFA